MARPDRKQTEEAITRLYARVGISTPVVIWVENPVQLMQVPFLLQSLASVPHGKQRRILRRTKVHVPPPDLGWQLGNQLQGQWLESYITLCKQTTPEMLARFSEYAHYESTIVSAYKEPNVLFTCGSRMGFPAASALWALLNEMTVEAHSRIASACSVNVSMQLVRLFRDDGDRRAWNGRRTVGLALGHLGMRPQSLFQDLSEAPFFADVPQHMIHELIDQCADLVDEFAELQDTACHHPRVDGTSALKTVEKLRDGLHGEKALHHAARNEIYSLIWGRWTQDQMYLLEAVESLFGEDVFGARISGTLHDFLSLRAGAFAYVLNSRCVIACALPEAVHFDESDRLHNFDGPALVFPDGWNVHAWRGIFVSDEAQRRHAIMRVSEIESERNVELRRVLIDRYGAAKFLTDSGAQVLHQDKYGVLYRKSFQDDEAMVMVRVINSTLEPDGTAKHYYLRVPPGMTTAREAVAWTFAMEEGEYKIRRQT